MGLEHVETQVISSATGTVDFTNVFDGSADRYLVYIDNVVPDADGTTIAARVSSDGGSTWDSGTSDYSWVHHQITDTGSTADGGSGSTDWIRFITGNVDTNNTSQAIVTVHEPENSNKATVLQSKRTANNLSVGFVSGFNGGERLAQTAVDSIQFLGRGGNIASGIFSVYAVTEDSAGAKEHIQTIEANSQSSVDFTSVFGSNDGYDRYEIHCDNVISSDNEALYARYSSDGGSNWDSGTSDYAQARFRVKADGSSSGFGNSGTDAARLDVSGVGDAPANNDTFSLSMTISEPTNSNRATVQRAKASRYNNASSPSFITNYTGAIRLTQSAIDSIQFFMGSGDVVSGTFSVYGIGQ